MGHVKVTLRPLLGGWVALGVALGASAAWLAASAAAAQRLGLIFHLHPAAALIGGAWLYRRLEGGRPCTTRSVAFLIGTVALVVSYEDALGPLGRADPWPLASAIALGGALIAARILFRADRQ